MRAGRPFRFMAVLLCGWATARGIALYRDGQIAALPLVGPVARVVAAIAASPASAEPAPHAAAGHAIASRVDRVAVTSPISRKSTEPALVRTAHVTSAVLAPPPNKRDPNPAAQPRLAPAVELPPIARGPSRLAGSAWVIARGGMVASVTGGQLGGSQAGARVTYALGSARTVALAARVSAPLAGRGLEAAVGIDWQPTRAPVHVIAERRFAIDGGRGGTVIGVIGGFGPAAVMHGLTLEGYGQAGVIQRDGVEGFGDGALRAAHPIADIGRVRVDIGGGAWGGAQRGASRLDVGPSLGIVVPVGARSLRLMADWRQRVAGSARPGSGPALSLGTNF